MHHPLRCLFLLACVLCAPAVFAQPPKADQTAPPIDEDEIVRVNASEVLLPVTVRDATGQLVTTLARKDFHVLENGREQPLSDLALRQVPVDVVLMVDASSSVASNLDDFRRAVEEFAARLAPEDRVSLVKFDDRVELLQDWTTSRVQLRRALRRVTGGTFTRFNDALYLAAREQFANAQRRHAVVVLSDGIDHSGPGSVTLEQSLRALIEAGATVYCISNTQIERVHKQAELESLLSAPESAQKFNALHLDDLRLGLRVLDASERNLAQLTDATGGRLYRPPSFVGLDQIYAEVAEELRHQYALYYTPLDTARDGRFRRVQVKTNDPTMRVATRIGYFAPHN
jgi:Ca-activated chloride channel family protein